MGKYAGKGTELRETAWQFPEAAAGRLLFMHFIRQLCCRSRQRRKSVENKEEHMAIFEGAGVAIITPFHEDGSVNYENSGNISRRRSPEAPMPSSYAALRARLPR